MITNCAMMYGVILGLYWIMVFLLRLAAGAFPLLGLVYIFMLFGTLFVSRHFGRMFIKTANIGLKRVTFFQFWIFGILFFFYGSLLDGIVQLAYYEFINPEYIPLQFTLASDAIKNISTDSALIEQFQKVAIPSPIQMVMQFVWNSVMVGGVIFAFFSLFMLRKQSLDEQGNQIP